MDKKGKKKIAKFIFSILIWAMIGFTIGIVSSIVEIPPNYTGLPWYINMIIVVGIYFAAVGVHELGHAYSFSKNGVKMRAVFILFLFFVKENHHWRMKFRPNNITVLGGIAIPDMEVVKTEEEIDRLQKAYAKAILAGPVVSFLFWGVLTILAVPFMLFSTNELVNSISFTVAVSITFITVFLLGTSFIKNEVAIGDFPAYKLAKTNRFFVAMQLYQYAIFSSDYERVRAENTFLRRTLIDGLQQKLDEKDTHIYTIGLIDQFIIEYLSGTIDELPQVIWNYVDFLTDDTDRLSKLKSSELSLGAYIHIVRLLYSREATKEKAMKLYTAVKDEIKPTTAMRKYLFKQTDHALRLNDNSEFLNKKENICISPAHGIWKNFDGYYTDELKLNRKQGDGSFASSTV